MAQHRFTERRQVVDSYNKNDQYLGALSPGRYAGFDAMTNISTLSFDIQHHVTGMINYARDSHLSRGEMGVWMSRQGVVIKEDDDVTGFTVDTNVGNTQPRIDILVGSHEYHDVTDGGVAATYSIIKGTPGSGVPALTDVTRQVILGYINLLPGQSVLTGSEWVPARFSGPGYSTNVVEQQLALFQKQVSFKQSTNVTVQAADSDHSWPWAPIDQGGNSFRLTLNGNSLALLPSRQAGTFIFMQVTDSGTIQQRDPTTDDYRQGYTGIRLGVTTLTVIPGAWYLFLSVQDADLTNNVHWKVFSYSGISKDIAAINATLAGLSAKKNTLTAAPTRVQIASGDVVNPAELDSYNDDIWYHKDDNYLVHISGKVTVNANTLGYKTFYTLPVGYRPISELDIRLPDDGGNHLKFRITTSGEMQIDNLNQPTPSNFSLDFLSFVAMQ